LTGGSGSLQGTTSLDIGTAAGNGTATFTNVECTDAGFNKEITASAGGLTNATSAEFFVAASNGRSGGSAIPSSYAGTTYTNLTGPVYYEVTDGRCDDDGQQHHYPERAQWVHFRYEWHPSDGAD
jgi:hypothetical protein